MIGRRSTPPRWFSLSLLGCLVTCANLWSASPPVQVLIFSGQNNHDWKQTTPKLKSILTTSDRFAVEVTEHPEKCDAKMLARYDVILSDWNTFGNPAVTNWPESTKSAFLEFVRNGKGFVTVHAGSSSFYDWSEYQQLVGASWNLGTTSHGSPHEFTVKPSPDHPITRGVAPFKTTDELWIRPGLDPGAKILATGDDQPVALCTSFGKGRGFTLLLGHSADFTDTPGFQTLVLRGTEWAAKGEVSLPPTAGERLAQAAILQAVSKYHLGDSRKSVLSLENLTAAIATDPDAKADLAAQLATILSSDATLEAKQIACQALSLIGSAKQVVVLAGLVADKDLGYHARSALERIPDAEAEKALIAALRLENGEVRRNVINSLAARQSAKAVPEIAKYIADPNPLTAAAAINALGRIGAEPAAIALTKAPPKVPSALKPLVAEALLRCACGMIASGNPRPATPILEALATSEQPPYIRIAALSTQMEAMGEKGSAVLLARLSSRDEVMQAAAIRALAGTRPPALLHQAAQQLETLPGGLQVQLITLLGDRGEATVVPVLAKATSSSSPDVREAAILALGLAGNAETISVLANLGATGNNEEKRLVIESLARLRGNDVNPRMISALNECPAPQQRGLIQALVLRGVGDAVPVLIALANGKESPNQNEIINAVGKLGNESDCARLAPLLSIEPEATASALAEISRRANVVEPVLTALSSASPTGQAALLEALDSIGGPQALEAVRKAVKSTNQTVRTAAVRSLANWPDASPLDDLAELASATDDSKCQALALRGVARLAPMATGRSPEAVVRIVTESMKAGGSLNERRALLAALGEMPGEESLKAVQRFIDDPALGTEAKAALAQIRAGSANAPAPLSNDAALMIFASLENLSRGGTATNLDGLAPDGQGQGPYAALDGDPSTYWDETDNQKLYWIRVQLKQRSAVACLRILGWQHQNYAPRDFEVIGDGKLLKKVENAEYENNLLTLDLPPSEISTIELKITGYYGQSPAIRELGLFAKPGVTK